MHINGQSDYRAGSIYKFKTLGNIMSPIVYIGNIETTGNI